MDKMRKYFFIVLAFKYASIAFAQNDEVSRSRYKELLSIISQEIEEVAKLDKMAKGKDPDLKIRMANYILEQSRLLREEENFEYLTFNSKNRSKINKKVFFRNSRRKLDQAKSLALSTVNQFPGYRKRVEVYYILGYYEREYNNLKSAAKLFAQAEKNLSFQPELKQKVYTALAEMSFSDKKYSKAKDYYERVINDAKDTWWTKDAYNLGWCYYETGNLRESINWMKSSFRHSSSGRYIDMRPQVNQALALIYAQSGNLKEGIQFYKSQGPGIELQLIELSKNLKLSGKVKQSLSLLDTTYNLSIDPKMKAKVLVEKLKMSDESRDIDEHLRDSKEMADLYKQNVLSDEDALFLRNQIQKQVSLLQKKQDLNYRDKRSTFDKKTSNYVNQYSSLWAEVDQTKAAEAKLIQADSFLKSENGSMAFKKYQESFELAKNSSKKKLVLFSAQGLIRSVDLMKPANSNYANNLEFSLKSFISLKRKDKETQEVYRRLFRFYFERQNSEAMKDTLKNYRKEFTFDHQTQEKMVSSLITVYQKQKNDENLQLILKEIKNDDYAVSQKYKKSLMEIEQKFEFKRVELLIDKGNTEEAASGYFSLYQDPKSGPNSKSFAAYNLMTLSYKKNYLQSTYDWGVKALNNMNPLDVEKYRNEFLSVSYYLSDRFQFNAAADFSSRVLSILCRHQDGNTKTYLFLNLLKNSMAQARENFQSIFNLAVRCNINDGVIRNAQREVLFYLKDEKFNDALARFVNEQKSQKTNLDILPEFACHLSKEFSKRGRSRDSRRWAAECKSVVALAERGRALLSKKSLDAAAMDEIQALVDSYQKFIRINLSFPESNFKQNLTKKLKQLEVLNQAATKLQRQGAPEGIYRSFDITFMAYYSLGNELISFTPPGGNLDYNKSFKQSMKKIATPLIQRSREIYVQGKKLMETQNILVKGTSDSPFHISMLDELNFMGANL
jgi:hypothetical protein